MQAGERVAVAANFLLDSESRLRGAVTSKSSAPAAGRAGRHQHQRSGTARGRCTSAGQRGHSLVKGSKVMIRKVIAFSAHNRLLVLLATAAAVVGAVYVLEAIRLDALPDLSDTQVIIYSQWDRSPDIIEDQVTYPITTALLGAPHVKAIRGFSDFGFSYVYVVFEDGTDIYWARSRVLEYLSKIQSTAARGRADRARAGRDRRRLGVPVRPGRSHRQARSRTAPIAAGLDGPLRAPGRPRRVRGRVALAAS